MNFLTNKLAVAVACVLLAGGALAEGTRTWEQSKYEDLEKGTAKGVAIRSEGGLELAPAFTSLLTTPSTYIWGIADDGQGNVYAAAGAPARVYRITPQGQASIVFQPEELQVQALVVGKDGVIYAATSPDGKVYKIERSGAAVKPPATQGAATRGGGVESEQQPGATQGAPAQQEKPRAIALDPAYKSAVFFDPGTKYIWDLALDAQGQLYVATGDRGEIFRVQKNGEHALFFKSDEAHIRVLAFDPKGNLIAGSDGSGLVYRISPAGEGFVLYSAPKKEITALAVDSEGNIYAAGVGEKRPAGLFGPSTQPPASVPTTTITVTATPTGPQPGPQQQAAPTLPPPFSSTPGMVAPGGSEVYRIAPDGSPKRLWSSREDVAYALAFDQGRLVVGTGNKGRVFAIRGQDEFTDLVKASASQVTALARASRGGLYAATSNLGKVFFLGAAPDTEGTYESDVFDAKNFSRWGRAEVRGSGTFELFARSGNVDNPDRNWSPWRKVDFGKAEGQLDIPAARFVQWKAVLRPGNPAPAVDSVVLNYLPKNVAPEIDDVVVQPGARFQQQPRQTQEMVTVNVGEKTNTPTPHFEPSIPALKDPSAIAVRWTASDDNDDDLVYSIYYRGDNESRWKLLKDGITEKYYSFDAALLPDGGYEIKVVASDARSHSPNEALTTSKTSSRFEVDTTPPQVQDLKALAQSDTVQVTFRAVDGFSPIKRAEYSVDAGDWQYLEPVGELSDFRVEEYRFNVPLGQTAASASERRGGDGAPVAPSDEHVVVVRVYDRFDNMGSAKTVVRK